ncbi:hypothetical protein [Photobacterium nomapromontoriensis]|uniref:hypothetical protein n=1 Tax=Photobacterium nomapromontoriensis TaxID=2910237 RepID=UPI003D0A2821
MKGTAQDDAKILLNDYFGDLKATGELSAFIQGIASSQKFLKSHMGFLEPLSKSLEQIIADKLLVKEFVEKWCQLDEKSWLESLDALQKLVQVWWKSELWKHELEAEYKEAKDAFNALLATHNDALKDLNANRFDKWGILVDHYKYTHLII